MRNIRLIVGGCFFAAISTAANACESSYDPTSGAATLRCVEVPGDPRSFEFRFRPGGGNNFVVTATFDYDVREAHVTGLRILTSPFPLALLSGFYPNGCYSAYKRPIVNQTGTTIDIRVKMTALNNAPFGCFQAIVPFVEAVPISPAGDPRSQTYFVNGARMIPTF
jgi:hypothetical protein